MKGGTQMNNHRTNDDKIRSSQMNNHWIHDNGMNERINDEAWIKEVRRLMAEREVKAPDHLLDAVKRELAAQAKAQPASSQKARIVPLRSYRWAAAAAIVVAIALPVTIHMLHKEDSEIASSAIHGGQSSALRKTDVSPRSAMQSAISAATSSNEAAVSSSFSATPYIASNNASSDTPLTPNTLTSNTQTSPNTPTPNTQTSPDTQVSSKPQSAPKAQQTPSTKPRRSYDYSSYDTSLTPNTHHPSPNTLSLTAYCGGIGSGSGNGSGMSRGFLMSDAAPYGITSIDMLTGANKNGFVAVDRKKMKAHHNQPIKVGVSVGYALTNRWAVNTGVTYSYLSSDFTADGEPKQTQKLHYVGIPLSASYSVLKSRKAEVYVTAGGEIEKLVKGTVSSESNLPSSHNEKIKESRPQFSAKAALGGAYHFTPSLSVYAEPGVSYYFDNHSSVTNVYKDRPTSFSLNIGVRYTVK
jgi:hypothetical protein